jgi:hypothetical protein
MFKLFNRKKKYSFYGNCQLDNICNQLNESNQFKQYYEYVPVKAVYLLDKNDLKGIENAFSDIDILFYQGVGSNFKNGPEFASDNVLTFLKKDCKKILIPSLFFNAYFPDFHEVAVEEYGVITTQLMGSFHDTNILGAYVNNMSVNSFFKLYTDENYYDRKYCLDLLNNAFNNLEERETNNRVDIKISKFLRENYSKQKLFNCQNHPKPPLFQYVVDEIIRTLGHNVKVNITKSNLDSIESAVHPSIHKNLNLDFENKIEFLTSRGTITDYKTIIELFYEEYRKIDIKILKKAIIDTDYVNKKIACRAIQ